MTDLRTARELVRAAATFETAQIHEGFTPSDALDLALETYVTLANNDAECAELAEQIAGSNVAQPVPGPNCYGTAGIIVKIGDRLVAKRKIAATVGNDIAPGDMLTVQANDLRSGLSIIDDDGDVYLEYADETPVWINPGDLAGFAHDELRVGDRVRVTGFSANGYEAVDVTATLKRPVTAGTYAGYWLVTRDDHAPAGCVFPVSALSRI